MIIINKLVSVIIPTYNASKFIDITVNSVHRQTYSNFELIIIDDGSTDDTEEIVKKYLLDERVKYFKIKNGGVSNARNYGAMMSKGEYLCFLDADDFFLPNNLKEKVDVLNSDESIGLVHADILMVDEEGNETGEISIGLSGKNLHLDILEWVECVIPAPSSIMVKRKLFYEAGTWDPFFSTAADQDLFIYITLKTNVHRIKKTLTGYRIVNQSMSKNVTVFEKDHIGVYRKADKHNLFITKKFKRICFANLYFIIAGNWWKAEKNIVKTIKYLFLALFYSPIPTIKKLFNN